MRKIFGIFILGVIIFMMSCDVSDPDEAGDVFIEVTPSTSGYVWESEIEIIVTAENENKVDYVTITVDGVEEVEDHLPPYSVSINTNQWQYQEYLIEAEAVYTDNSKSDKSAIVTFICCPIYEDDLLDFTGITETTSTGALVVNGNVDDDDWHFGDGIAGTTFGPAFPNPCQVAGTIQYDLEVETRISIIIINSDSEIIDILKDNELESAGLNEVQWAAPANVNDLYRVIFHTEDDSHWHGDILVE